MTSHNSHHAPANGETNPLDAIINELLHDDLYPLSNPYRAKKPVNTLTAPHHTDYKLPPSGTVTTHTGNTTTVLSWDSSQTTTTAKISSTQNTMSNRTATRASSSTTSNALGHGHGYGSGYAGSAASHSPLSHNSLAGRGQGQGPPVPPTRSSHPHSTLQRAATLNDGHVEHIKLGDAVSVEIPLGGRSSVNVHQQGQQHSPIGIRTESTMRGGRGGDTSPYATTSAPQPPPRTSHPASGTSSLQQPNNADFTSLQSKPVSASSRYEASSSSYSRGYFSDSEDPLSWLDQQRSRLDTIRYGSKLQKRSEQEQHMVDELKSSIRRRPGGPSGADSDSEAMTSWTERRTETRRTLPVHSAAKSASMDHSDSIFASAAAEQRNTLSRRGEVRTGGRSMSVPDSDDEELRAKYRTEKRYFVSGLERTPSHDKQTKYTFSMAGSDGQLTIILLFVEKTSMRNGGQVRSGVGVCAGEPLSPRSAALANKPPASPGQASSRPSLPPRGTSSREVVSTLTRTQHTQGRVHGHVRHLSDSGVGRYSTLPTRLRSATPVSGTGVPQPPSYDSVMDDDSTPITTSRHGYFTFGRRARGSSVSAYATLPRGRTITRSRSAARDRSDEKEADIVIPVRSASVEPSRANFLKEYVEKQTRQLMKGLK